MKIVQLIVKSLGGGGRVTYTEGGLKREIQSISIQREKLAY